MTNRPSSEKMERAIDLLYRQQHEDVAEWLEYAFGENPCGEYHPLPCGLDQDCPESEVES